MLPFPKSWYVTVAYSYDIHIKQSFKRDSAELYSFLSDIDFTILVASPFLYPMLHNPLTASETTASSVSGFGLSGDRFFFLGLVGRLVLFLDLPVELDPLKRLGMLTEILTEVGVCRGGVGFARLGSSCNCSEDIFWNIAPIK